MKSFTFTDFLYRSTLYFALAVALTATLGSLYFSEIRHYLPCNLCWYQRILMYPLVVVIAVGLLRQDFNMPYYVLPLTLVGQGIATYHYLLEKTDIFSSPTSCQVGIPCTTPWINWGGFITIPFLAMCAFFLITLLSIIAMVNGEPAAEEFSSAPWIQVTITVAIVVAAFIAIYNFDPLRADQLTLTTPIKGEMTSVHAAARSTENPTENPTESQTLQVTEAFTTDTTIETSADITASSAVDEDAVAAGQQLYGANCAVCHGSDVQGIPSLGTSLVESTMIREQSEAEILAFIRVGRAADAPDNTTGIAMPPSGAHPELSDDEMLNIIAFLRAQ